MPDDADRERQWLVEPPPAPGEVSLFVAVGDGVQLTPEQEAALGALLRSLESNDADVVAYAADTPKCDLMTDCTPLTCKDVHCTLGCHPLSPKISATAASAWSLMGSFSPGT
jgi:hypothetical protein